MKTFNLQMFCQAYYRTSIEVPDDMTEKEAFEYAKAHIDDLPIEELHYVPDSDEILDEDIETPGIVYFSD